jgi:hypothetical protein
VIAFAGLVGAAPVVIAGYGLRNRRSWTIVFVSTIGLLLLWPTNWTQLQMSQFKSLPNTLQVV